MRTKAFFVLATLLTILMSVGAASASIRYVANDVACGPSPYATIAAAVLASSSGDTIIVCPGTYTEYVSLWGLDSLTITSTDLANPETTKLIGSFHIGLGDNVTIEGFDISNTADPFGVGIDTWGRWGTVAFNHIHDCNFGGVRFRSPSPDQTAGNFNTVHHNTINNNKGLYDKPGIESLPGTQGNILHHNVLQGNHWGIALDGADSEFAGATNTEVHHNTASGNDGTVVHVGGSNNNIHHNNSCDAIVLSAGSSKNLVHENKAPVTDSGTNNKVFHNTGCN